MNEIVSKNLKTIYCLLSNFIPACEELRSFFAASKDGRIRLIQVAIKDG